MLILSCAHSLYIESDCFIKMESKIYWSPRRFTGRPMDGRSCCRILSDSRSVVPVFYYSGQLFLVLQGKSWLNETDGKVVPKKMNKKKRKNASPHIDLIWARRTSTRQSNWRESRDEITQKPSIYWREVKKYYLIFYSSISTIDSDRKCKRTWKKELLR